MCDNIRERIDHQTEGHDKILRAELSEKGTEIFDSDIGVANPSRLSGAFSPASRGSTGTKASRTSPYASGGSSGSQHQPDLTAFEITTSSFYGGGSSGNKRPRSATLMSPGPESVILDRDLRQDDKGLHQSQIQKKLHEWKSSFQRPDGVVPVDVTDMVNDGLDDDTGLAANGKQTGEKQRGDCEKSKGGGVLAWMGSANTATNSAAACGNQSTPSQTSLSSSSSSTGSDGDAGGEVGAEWSCSACTLLNSPSLPVCDACGAPAPQPRAEEALPSSNSTIVVSSVSNANKSDRGSNCERGISTSDEAGAGDGLKRRTYAFPCQPGHVNIAAGACEPLVAASAARYRLTAVVRHIGSHAFAGHYICDTLLQPVQPLQAVVPTVNDGSIIAEKNTGGTDSQNLAKSENYSAPRWVRHDDSTVRDVTEVIHLHLPTRIIAILLNVTSILSSGSSYGRPRYTIHLFLLALAGMRTAARQSSCSY